MWSLIVNEYSRKHKFGYAEFLYRDDSGVQYGYSVMYLVTGSNRVILYLPYEIDEDYMSEIQNILCEDLDRICKE